MTAAELARLTGYTKRNVTEELDRLELAGLFQVAAPGNQFLYRLHDRDALLAFVGVRPDAFPRWEPLFRVVRALVDTIRAVEPASATVQAVELEKLVAQISGDLQAAELPLPPPTRERTGSPDVLLSWAFGLMRGLATGRIWSDRRDPTGA